MNGDGFKPDLLEYVWANISAADFMALLAAIFSLAFVSIRIFLPAWVPPSHLNPSLALCSWDRNVRPASSKTDIAVGHLLHIFKFARSFPIVDDVLCYLPLAGWKVRLTSDVQEEKNNS